MQIVYDIRNLVKIYPSQPQTANQDICLQIYAGEIFGLLGDNGAGKTTLVRQMANLLKPSAGTIELLGQPVGAQSLYVARYVGYMPQGALALNNLTVWEALYFTAHLRGLDRSQAGRAAQELVQRWQLEALRDKPNNRLSGGQQRLLQLAVAMAGDPPILILDEPTNELDPQRRKQVWEELRRMNREFGTTIIFITHDALEAEKIIQRVGIMHLGRLVALGKPSELKAQVDNQLRLELFFPPESPPRLPSGWQPYSITPGRWLVYLDRQEAAGAIGQLDLNGLDDFRLYSATLEDLYLHYANHH
jgi:ABC-2 type transport system ATP-binding protein